MRVYPLPTHLTRALVHKFKQHISHSRRRTAHTARTADTSQATPPEGESATVSATPAPAQTTPDLTYFELFRAFSGYDHSADLSYLVMLKGGCVRDLLQGVAVDQVHDIDIIHTMPFGKARFGVPYGLNAQKVQYYERHTPTFKYIKVGQQRDMQTDTEPVDCVETRFPPLEKYEAPVNSLLINVTQGRRDASGSGRPELDRVYDITGKGMDHLRQRVWGAPDNRMLTDVSWLSNGMLWRMLKFAMRGYRIPSATQLAVYRHWAAHHDTFVANGFGHVWENPWKKHFGVDAGTSAVAAHDRVVAALVRVTDIVGKQLDQFSMDRDGFGGASAAASFCDMLIRHHQVVAPGQYGLLSDIRQHSAKARTGQRSRRAQKPAPTPLPVPTSPDPDTNGAVQTAGAEVDATSPIAHATALLAHAVQHTTFHLPGKRTVLCPKGPDPKKATDTTSSAKAGKRLSHSSSPFENPTDVAAHHPDVARVCAYLHRYADSCKADRDGARKVLKRLCLLVQVRLLTTYPVRSWPTDPQAPVDYKNAPVPFDYPRPAVLGTGLEFGLERGVWDALYVALSNVCVTCASPAKTDEPSRSPKPLWKWLCEIASPTSKHPAGVYLRGLFVEQLIRTGVVDQHLEHCEIEVCGSCAAGSGKCVLECAPTTDGTASPPSKTHQPTVPCVSLPVHRSCSAPAPGSALRIDLIRRAVLDTSVDGQRMVLARRLGQAQDEARGAA